jgi:hypothetical protein
VFIYTSSWFTKLPDSILKIGISRSVPRGYPAGYRRIRELEPGSWFNSVTPIEYHRLFMEQLALLSPRQVFAKIDGMAREGAERSGWSSPSKDVALLCFEAPEDPDAWCHRGQVAAWLKDTLDLDVYEFGLAAGAGWSHPKLYKDFRK